jgi:hypothetical protein
VVLDVEHHARPQQDYYSLTALLDFTSFIYLALFYQVVMSSARSLADLTDEKQLPWDYLTALLLLFVIMVVDRLVYSLGSQLGKALLLLGQLLLFIPFCMSLFWSPVVSSSSSRPKEHLRVFLVLKAASWVSSALQLRSGFPPRASFTGGGRQMFVFYSKADVWHLMGYYIFQVCSPTMLTVSHVCGRQGQSVRTACCSTDEIVPEVQVLVTRHTAGLLSCCAAETAGVLHGLHAVHRHCATCDCVLQTLRWPLAVQRVLFLCCAHLPLILWATCRPFPSCMSCEPCWTGPAQPPPSTGISGSSWKTSAPACLWRSAGGAGQLGGPPDGRS